MHVDGFRFDEGSILSRGADGSPMQYPPVLWHIELSEKLADTKIIAEAWDAAGLYQIGYFPGFRWAEWNGRFRDDVRRFVRGDAGIVGQVANRISGSADLYEASGHLPLTSINFVTCHDGFTLQDLVSYDDKHNEANGEGNRDGINENLSWNCGVEGPTDDPKVETLRKQQIKNFAAILMVSQGIPMVTAGGDIPGDGPDIHVMLNMDDAALAFALPPVGERSWYRAVDTAQPSPTDIMEPGSEVLIDGDDYLVGSRSAVVLISR